MPLQILFLNNFYEIIKFNPKFFDMIAVFDQINKFSLPNLIYTYIYIYIYGYAH